MMADDVEQLIVGFIGRELSGEAGADAVDLDENLFTGGMVDSVGIVRLVGYLQERLGVTIPPPDLVPDNFRTIRVMAAYMRGLRAPD